MASQQTCNGMAEEAFKFYFAWLRGGHAEWHYLNEGA